MILFAIFFLIGVAFFILFMFNPSISYMPLVISIIFFVLAFVVQASKDLDKEIERDKKVENNFMKKMNLDNNSLKFKIQQNNDIKEYLAYTNEKRLFFVNITKEQIKELFLNEILKIDIQVITQEKTKQEILTLTPTFHTQRTILSYRLKIITESETTVITVAPTYNNKELLERFKLVLERDIKEITGNILDQ